MTEEYNEIKNLSPKEHIRIRSGMYIGDKSTPNHLFTEVLDNAIDEALAGYAKDINIDIEQDHFSVSDTGRGLPIGKNSDGESYVSVAFTKINSGGKYNNKAYSVSSGTNGVGIKAVNFLSNKMEVSTCRYGIGTKLITEDGDIVLEETNPVDEKEHGTTVTCYPLTKWKNIITEEEFDNFFDTIELKLEPILERLRLVKTLLPKVNIKLKHYSNEKYINFLEIDPYSNSEILNLDEKIKTYELSGTIKSDDSHNGETFNIKFGFDTERTKFEYGLSTVNMLKVQEGEHMASAEWSFISAFQDYVDKETREYLKDRDYLIGLHLSVNVTLRSPSYTSQTKQKLAGSWGYYKYLRDEMTKVISKWLWKSENRDLVLALIARMKLYRESQNKSGNFKLIEKEVKFGDVNKDENGAFKVSRKLSSLASRKLIECSGSNVEESSLYICEGNSAATGLMKKRDPKKHALLLLRGKVLNCVDMDIKKIIQNLEYKLLINTIGIGCLDNVRIDKCRYGKICIACDADSDGFMISALLIGAFSYLMPEIITSGKLYLVKTPLFVQNINGKEVRVYKEEDLNHDYPLERYKGLGAIPLEKIKDYFFNENAILEKVTVEKVEELRKVMDLVGYSAPKKQLLLDRGLLKE